MTILRGKNIQLRIVNASDIELMRSWRNSAEIKRYHIYREDISVQEQQTWFARIDNSTTNFFFIIEKDKKKYGVTKLQDIDLKKKEGQAGIYIADPEDRCSFVSAEAAILVIDYFFRDLKLKKLTATALIQNRPSISFIEKLGFTLSHQKIKLIDNISENVNFYTMNQCDYDICTKKIRARFVNR